MLSLLRPTQTKEKSPRKMTGALDTDLKEKSMQICSSTTGVANRSVVIGRSIV